MFKKLLLLLILISAFGFFNEAFAEGGGPAPTNPCLSNPCKTGEYCWWDGSALHLCLKKSAQSCVNDKQCNYGAGTAKCVNKFCYFSDLAAKKAGGLSITCGPSKKTICKKVESKCTEVADCQKISSDTDPVVCAKGYCYLSDAALLKYQTSPASTNLYQELKPPKINIRIPNVSFTDITKGITEDGTGNKYINIPWIGQYVSALYSYSLAVVSIVAVIMIIVQGVVIMTSGGGERKAAGFKRVGQITIGLIIMWTSYFILYSINPDLVKFKALRVRFLEGEELPVKSPLDPSAFGESTNEASCGKKANIGVCVKSYDIPKYKVTKISDSHPFTHLGVIWGHTKRGAVLDNLDKIDWIEIGFTQFKGGKIVGGSYLTNAKDQRKKVAKLITDIRAKKPNIPVTVMMTILFRNSTNRVVMMQSPDYDIFKKYAIEVIKEHNLDGVSLDLEHPSPYHEPKVKNEDTTKFIKQFRKDVEAGVGKKIRLSMYSGGGPSKSWAFDYAALSNELDYILPMTYGSYNPSNSLGITGPYTPVFKAGNPPFQQNWTLERYVERLSNSIPAANRKKILLGAGSWPANIYRETANALPCASYVKLKKGDKRSNFTPHRYAAKRMKGKEVCYHPTGVKYGADGTTQYWFEDYETFLTKFKWLKKQIDAGKIGGWFDWSTNRMGNEFWAAISDVW